MNGEGGCCIAKYGGGGGTGGGGGVYGMSKVDRIMLKFRPIAPKPVAAGSGSGGSTTDNSDGYVKCGRSKRKYVRVKNKNDNTKRRGGDQRVKVKVKASSSTPPVVTLSLLPETPDPKLVGRVTSFSDLLSPVSSNSNSNNNNNNNNNHYNTNKLVAAPVWLSFNSQEQARVPTVVAPPVRLPQVVSYVTVECVTDTWVDWELLGCTDEEIVTNMEKDTCPGFISDGEDKVVWTNAAYRRMAGDGRLIDDDDIAVVLVRKDKWDRIISPVVTLSTFTCKMRVSFGGRSHRKSGSPTLTLPCDGWRMEDGGCAWRLDVKAALSLGR